MTNLPDSKPLGMLAVESIDKPVECEWQEAMRISDRLIACLRKDKASWSNLFWELLGERLRILQLEIMPRDLSPPPFVAVNFHSGTSLREVKGYLPVDRLSELVERHCRLKERSSGGKRDAQKEVPPRERYEAFEHILSRAAAYNPHSYEDFLAAFAARYRSAYKSPQREAGFTADVMLVEDGEFTFFTLLWLFRYGHKKRLPVEEWVAGRVKTVPLDFQPTSDTTATSADQGWWSHLTREDLYVRLGIALQSSDGGLVPTARWKAFVAWLRRQRNIVAAQRNLSIRPLFPESIIGLNARGATGSTTSGLIALPVDLSDEELIEYVKPFLSVLPIKHIGCLENLRTDADRRPFLEWIYLLIALFLSQLVVECLSATDNQGAVININDFFQKFFGPTMPDLVRQLLADEAGLLDTSTQSGDHDLLLQRLARPGYLPLEYVLRNSLPFEMHLLIVPFDFVEDRLLGTESGEMTPTSLGFMTIAGPIDELVGAELQAPGLCSEEESQARTLTWLQPYYTILSRLDHYFTTEALWRQRDSRIQMAADSRFGHETKHVILGLRDGWKRPLISGDHADSYFDISSTTTPLGTLKLGALYVPSKDALLEFLNGGPLRNMSVRRYVESRGLRLPGKEFNEKPLREYVEALCSQPVADDILACLTSDFYASFSLITHDELFARGLDYLLLWSDPERGAASLFKRLAVEPDTVDDIARTCWEWAIDSVLVHMFRDQLFSPSHIQGTSSKIWALRRIYERVPLLFGSDSPVGLPRSERDKERGPYGRSILIANYFLVLFREHLQHSRYLTAPKLFLGQKIGGVIQVAGESLVQEPNETDRARARAIIREVATISGFEGFSDEDLFTLVENGINRLADASPRGLGKRILIECLRRIDPGATFRARQFSSNAGTVYRTEAEFSFLQRYE